MLIFRDHRLIIANESKAILREACLGYKHKLCHILAFISIL
jgi:hypothetical protein